MKNLKKATAKKPVLIIKSGRTQAGAKASASHTASMAVEDAVFDGIVRQAGAIRLHAIDEFVRTLKGFLNMPLPVGDRLAYVTYSGAQAIMSIDTTMEQGLQTASLRRYTDPNRTRDRDNLQDEKSHRHLPRLAGSRVRENHDGSGKSPSG